MTSIISTSVEPSASSRFLAVLGTEHVVADAGRLRFAVSIDRAAMCKVSVNMQAVSLFNVARSSDAGIMTAHVRPRRQRLHVELLMEVLQRPGDDLGERVGADLLR
ncbi:hypothetical protein ACFWA4_22010 [Streptomyces sp. NPDC060011]|uniref:hypothetical protein n=1 Tax=Streptomyces sp. NPDC060011 TaxID=3347037 RepID=UPI0036C16FF7